jgi:hypothetical protein
LAFLDYLDGQIFSQFDHLGRLARHRQAIFWQRVGLYLEWNCRKHSFRDLLWVVFCPPFFLLLQALTPVIMADGELFGALGSGEDFLEFYRLVLEGQKKESLLHHVWTPTALFTGGSVVFAVGYGSTLDEKIQQTTQESLAHIDGIIIPVREIILFTWEVHMREVSEILFLLLLHFLFLFSPRQLFSITLPAFRIRQLARGRSISHPIIYHQITLLQPEATLDVLCLWVDLPVARKVPMKENTWWFRLTLVCSIFTGKLFQAQETDTSFSFFLLNPPFRL